MGCALSKPEPPKPRLLHDLSKPYKYPQTQHAPSRHQPMQYAAQTQAPTHRQKPPRLPVAARVKDNRRHQAESPPQRHPANPKPSHNTEPQAPSSHRAHREYQVNQRSRAPSNPSTTHQPTPSPWPLQNPIPNRFESPFPPPSPPAPPPTHPPITTPTLPKKPTITHPPLPHHSHHATIALPLPEGIETKARLSRYWDTDPVMGYGPPSPTESDREYTRLQRLSRPLGEYGWGVPEVVSESPVEGKWRGEEGRRRAKGKGRGLRLDVETGKGGKGEVRGRHEEWVGGRVSPEFGRIEAIEMGLVDWEGERRREEEWDTGVRI